MGLEGIINNKLGYYIILEQWRAWGVGGRRLLINCTLHHFITCDCMGILFTAE